MKVETYKALLKDLQKLQKGLVASQIAAVRGSPGMWGRMVRLHGEAEVGGGVDDFVATTARKSTVLFLLRAVFVRVLEDLGILGLRRIRDDWGFAAFREVAPALGKRAYFAFVFRDLAVDFPALFTAGEDELPLPDEDGCRALWDVWHHPNKEGESYIWNGEGFDSRFLGDLYQDLDADIRKRYALLQTPRFVEEYILDHTLTPALAEFDPAKLWEAGERFRVIDPTCGSGHFLIGAFHRMADYWRDRHGLKEWEACERALTSVWGCDINPHAVEIAAFRLMLEVVARTQVKDLERLSKLKLNLRAMDSLIPWERTAKQGELFPAKDRLDAYATPEQRRENAEFLKRDFHVVVGNPPYITPKDVRKRDDYRVFWPDSAAGKYALSAPFVERFFAMGAHGAFVGQITANSFMKREFGNKLITTALPRFELTCVIDTSGAYIPGHGTPTVILFGRNRKGANSEIWAILGKRGEPKKPSDGASGLVWSAIAGYRDPINNDDSPFVTSALVPRETFARHPWSLGGGSAGEIASVIANDATATLEHRCSRIGMMTILNLDEVYLEAPPAALRDPIRNHAFMVLGTNVRDFSMEVDIPLLFPYSVDAVSVQSLNRTSPLYQHFWLYREYLYNRNTVGLVKVRAKGMSFYEFSFHHPLAFVGLGICFAFVSTHNHFVLNRGGKVFKQSAPVIKLPPTASLDDHIELLGLLNSSTLGFWMKQVFHNKHGSGDGKGMAEEWMDRYEYDATKLQQAPVTGRDRDARIALASAIDAIALERAACLPAALLAADTWSPETLSSDIAAAHTRYLTHTRRMVALQEELDWLTYSSYALIDPVITVPPGSIEPLAPGHRPFEILLARRDDEVDDEEKSVWWSLNGYDRVTEIPDSYSEAHRARLQERLDLIESDPRLALLETPPYKRRWQLADWPSETKKAAESWLLDRLEDLFAPATDTTPRGPLADPKPYRLEDITLAWGADPRVTAVAGVWSGTGLSVDITLVAEKLLRNNALPDNPHRVYSAEGLRRLAAWKRVWALQDQEDAWEKAATEAKARGETPPKKQLVDPDDPTKELDSIPLPPKLEKTDFLRPEYFSLRGKLNVPRERFVLFADLSPQRYGWNGWRNRDRALAQVGAYTLAEDDPMQPLPLPSEADPRRCGVTYGLWESLPDVRRWGDPEEHAELSSLAREACHQQHCPCPVVEPWKARILPGTSAGATSAAGKKGKLNVLVGPPEEPVSDRPPVATLAERAWVASLFPRGKDLDIAALWSLHRTRLSAPPQQTLPGVPAPAVQLTMPEFTPGPSAPLVAMDEARLAFVLDDLVASGDVEVRGRGKKRRYKSVPRGMSS